MASVAVVGERGAGKSVLLALLAATVMKPSANKKGGPMYFAPPQVTDAVGGVVEALRSGRWPSEGEAESAHAAFARDGILLGFPKPRGLLGVLGSGSAKNFATVNIKTVDAPGGDEVSSRTEGPGGWDGLVLALDASRLTTEDQGERRSAMTDAESLLVEAVSRLGFGPARRNRSHRSAALALALTKFDTLERAVAGKLAFGAAGSPQPAERSLRARALMQGFMPSLLTALGGTKSAGPAGSTGLFVSWARPSKAGDPNAAHEGKVGGGDLDYPSGEYAALIEFMKTKAT